MEKSTSVNFRQTCATMNIPARGHWFGESVDWQPIFDYFKWHSVSKNSDRDAIEFHTACPGVSSKSGWVEILQQERQMDFSSVQVTRDVEGRTISGSTDNVKRVAFDVSQFEGTDAIWVELDSLAKLEVVPGRDDRVIVFELAEQSLD